MTARCLAGIIVGMVLACLPELAGAQTRTVNGQSGILGEWALTAEVTEKEIRSTKQWIGPFSMKHVGFCSSDGPEERTGELRMITSDPPKTVVATLTFEGTACTFKGRLNGTYDGILSCPDRRDVPMMLSIQ